MVTLGLKILSRSSSSSSDANMTLDFGFVVGMTLGFGAGVTLGFGAGVTLGLGRRLGWSPDDNKAASGSTKSGCWRDTHQHARDSEGEGIQKAKT